MSTDFSRVGPLSMGYALQEVELFFLQAQQSLTRQDGRVTRSDAEQVRFSSQRRGFRYDEVDLALDELAARLPEASDQVPARPGPVEETDLEEVIAEISDARFETTTLSAGYDIGEVDDLLDLATATLRGDAFLTPDDLLEVRFSTTRLREGYDREQVDAFLDEQLSDALRRFGPQP